MKQQPFLFNYEKSGLDTNVIWQPSKRFSISLVGQNLLSDHHLEYIGPDQTEQSSLIKRSAYAKITWQF